MILARLGKGNNRPEREFLAAFIVEATTDPFQGPATDELHRRDIYYTDLTHLLAAYYRLPGGDSQGLGGQASPTLRACPWPDRATALNRDREIEAAMEEILRQETTV